MPMEQTLTFSGVLPVGLDLHGIVEEGGDKLTAAGVAGQKDVAAHVALSALDVELKLMFVHFVHLR